MKNDKYHLDAGNLQSSCGLIWTPLNDIRFLGLIRFGRVLDYWPGRACKKCRAAFLKKTGMKA